MRALRIQTSRGFLAACRPETGSGHLLPSSWMPPSLAPRFEEPHCVVSLLAAMGDV
jgi:hypothetical protein